MRVLRLPLPPRLTKGVIFTYNKGEGECRVEAEWLRRLNGGLAVEKRGAMINDIRAI